MYIKRYIFNFLFALHGPCVSTALDILTRWSLIPGSSFWPCHAKSDSREGLELRRFFTVSAFFFHISRFGKAGLSAGGKAAHEIVSAFKFQFPPSFVFQAPTGVRRSGTSTHVKVHAIGYPTLCTLQFLTLFLTIFSLSHLISSFFLSYSFFGHLQVSKPVLGASNTVLTLVLNFICNYFFLPHYLISGRDIQHYSHFSSLKLY